MKNKLFLILSVFCFSLNSQTGRVTLGIAIEPLLEKIDNQQQAPLWKRILHWPKPTPPSCMGIRMCFALQRHGLDVSSAWNHSCQQYSITDFLPEFYTSMCRSLVRKAREDGSSLGKCNSEDFEKFDAIARKYMDCLPQVLQECYGDAAKPLIAEITKSRANFEAENNGKVLLFVPAKN